MISEIGKITSWNEEKGFGFITPNSGGKSIFIHINDFSKKHKRPIQGLSVTYSLSKDSRGRICATNVCPEKGHKEVAKADRQNFKILRSLM
jgi:cold shock CspA family protein